MTGVQTCALPISLVLCALVLLLALRLGEGVAAEGLRPLGLVVWGTLAGLALWTHLMSASVVAAALVYLWLRARERRPWLVMAAVPLLAASAPAWLPSLRGSPVLHILKVSGRQETLAEHLASVLPVLHQPIAGLFGVHVPLIADAPDFVILASAWAAAGLVLVYGGGLVFAVREARASRGALLLLGAAALVLAAFPIPARSGPASIRFLSPMYLPVAVVLVWVSVHLGSVRRGWVIVLSLAVMHLSGSVRLLDAWRTHDRAREPFLLPDLQPVRQALESRGIRRAYASYGPAYRLTYESGERLTVSQPWNERFLHYPLPYLDEVRFAKNVAWVLTPTVPTDLPNPRAFESALGVAGGQWQKTDAGAAVIYHSFVPPFGSEVTPLPGVGPAGDGDVGTVLRPAVGAPTAFAFPEPMVLDAVSLVAGQRESDAVVDGPPESGGPALLRSMDVEVSADGVSFATVARRRRRGEREDLRWVNGHPQYVLDHDLLAVPLAGRTVKVLRITPVASRDPWTIGEILLHPARSVGGGWEEWMDPSLGWPERARVLTAHPMRDREDWYYRLLLARRRAAR